MASRSIREPADAGTPPTSEREALLRDALTARAQAEAARARAEMALREAEEARALADAARARHEFLAAAGRAMAVSMDYRTTLGEVVRAAVPVLADWCAVTMVGTDGELDVIALAHADGSKQERALQLLRRHPPLHGSDAGAPKVVRTGETELLTAIDPAALAAAAGDDEGRRAALDELRMVALLTVPLKTPTRVIGAITFALSSAGRRFAGEDVEVAASLAARAALHVQNARMYSERSHIAQTLQRSLLPPELPRIPGIDLAAGYRAAGDQHEVGGDFYDAYRAADGDWIVFLGDVCGKGAEAAALTSLTRHTLFAAALRGSDALASVRLANDALLARGDGLRFATLVHLRVRPRDGGGAQVRITNAGHLPPFLARADGTIEETTAAGTLLGIFADPSFTQQDLELAPGDLLLLYTDGITELRTADLGFGVRTLKETLRSRAGCSAAVIVEALERRVLELQDGQPRDDIATVALRALGADERDR
jgi:serine phosphatase RsbU (regulator of sigma subunit)